jgi:predicted nucleic acid-binding Zn ribbon protein
MLYDFECHACGAVVSREYPVGKAPRRITQEHNRPVTTRWRCNHKTLRRIISRPAVHFKGKGFYCTDYKQEEKQS